MIVFLSIYASPYGESATFGDSYSIFYHDTTCRFHDVMGEIRFPILMNTFRYHAIYFDRHFRFPSAKISTRVKLFPQPEHIRLLYNNTNFMECHRLLVSALYRVPNRISVAFNAILFHSMSPPFSIVCFQEQADIDIGFGT